MKYLLIATFCVLALASCKPDEGEQKPNQLPDTRFFVEQINTDTNNRLASEIHVYWSGTDQDGYVQGYELSINDSSWFYTTKTDSLFKFRLPVGLSEANFSLKVRAVDNQEARDETPAELTLPLENSPPSISHDASRLTKSPVPLVYVLNWLATDPDGNQTITAVEVKANNGDWFQLPIRENVVALVAEDITATGFTPFKVIRGDETVLDSTLIGLSMSDTNRLYLRATDQAGVYSKIDTLPPFVIKPKTADLLFVNGHSSTVDSYYKDSLLAVVYPNGIDNLDLTTADNQPAFFSLTLNTLLPLYDKVFWVASSILDKNDGVSLLIETAAVPLQNFLSKRGKLFLVADVPAGHPAPSPYYDLTPASGPTTINNPRIGSNVLVTPMQSGWNTLSTRPSGFNTNADPFILDADADSLYIVQLSNNTKGLVAAYTELEQGKINQIFFAVELTWLARSSSNTQKVQTMVQKALNESFDWE